jgi:phenylalanyl-tRNA synthetase beta subunit
LTISCLYRSGERTLTEEEISPVHNLVCRTLEERFRARFR